MCKIIINDPINVLPYQLGSFVKSLTFLRTRNEWNRFLSTNRETKLSRPDFFVRVPNRINSYTQWLPVNDLHFYWRIISHMNIKEIDLRVCVMSFLDDSYVARCIRDTFSTLWWVSKDLILVWSTNASSLITHQQCGKRTCIEKVATHL